jgi:hypothetical protein
MNCKPGDLAVIVRSVVESNMGRIVRCTRLATASELDQWRVRTDRGPVWIIEQPIPHTIGGAKPFSMDAGLRPIRPQDDDATDETLLWLPVPHKEPA